MSKKKINNISDIICTTSSDAITSTLNKTSQSVQTSSTNIKKTEINSPTLSTEDDIIEISQLKGKEIWHYSMLDKFFATCELPQIQRMVDIINGNHLISLRFMDWFVTRFCYLYKTTINIANQFCTQNNFNINISYKAQLKSFTKKYFDPFKRKQKFIFTLDKYKISFLTTLGQLNFFRWAMTNDIINYTETNYRTIVLKYDYVNSFFKKHNSSNSSNSNKSIQSTGFSSTCSTSATSATSATCNTSTLTNISEPNTKKDFNSNSNSVANEIYSVNNNNNISIEHIVKNKSTFKMPRVSRNIYIEL
jgi:hypothetical protein